MSTTQGESTTELRVLLIEDDEADALIFAHRLPPNYQLTRVSSICAALEQEGEWDVIILDLGLPGCVGLEALTRARAWRPDVPMLVLTGYDNEGFANSALRNGAQDYLVKGSQTGRDLCRAIRYAVERKRAQLALEAAQRKLKDAERLDAIGTLAAGIAHDFNNLLVSINANAELLLSIPNEEVQQAASAIRESGCRAATLTSQLLGFSQQGQVQRRRVALSPVLETLIERVDFGSQSAIDFHTCDGSVQGDPVQLARLFEDLIRNAVESYEGTTRKVVVTIKVEIVDSSLQVRVVDRGIGIPRELQTRVLEPFFSTKQSGQGLGLSNALGITLGHGGELELDSDPDRGTAVLVRLPLCSKPAESNRPVPLQPKSDSARGRVLIVDDEQSVRETGRRVLSRLGFEVETSGRPRSALESLRSGETTADIILLDMVMPEMHGESFLRQLRDFNPSQAVIVCTGYTDLALEEPDNCTGLLLKPYTIAELRAEIARLCPHLCPPDKVPLSANRSAEYESQSVTC